MPIPFNAEEVKRIIMEELIPKGYPQLRLEEGHFVYESKWKKGECTKILLDNNDITALLSLEEMGDAIEHILSSAKKFRRNFTGTFRFYVNISNSKIETIYVEQGSFMISRRTNKKYYKN